ncbi:uncharacterized protein LOC6559564 [Drosophila grimshawi]|uniref:GH20579 n=1 Tax=Drosophila grimshawi TaxID=7222 RepID=B4J866_DROGR|nr:uncharacterized protein LOC6559564 [Drosophila grimshawi]EDW01203.1 GH20579 [Drosophila grimshawi]
MRTKHLILILIGVIIATIVFIAFGPAGEPNDSFKHIVVQTHQQLKEFQENLRVGLERKKLDLEPKYFKLLGFASPLNTKENDDAASHQPVQQHQETDTPVTARRAAQELQQLHRRDGTRQMAAIESNLLQELDLQEQQLQQQQQQKSQRKRITTPYNGTKANFTIVTYVQQERQVASAILLAQNIAAKLPSEYLLIYDLGVSEEQLRTLTAYCNSSRCTVITYDLSEFPSSVNDQRTHAYRPIVIKDALMRAKSVLFAENYMRIRGGYRELHELQNRVMVSGVLGWNTPTAVSSRTHPKMFDYFESNAENFIFLRMVDLDTVFFADTLFVTEKIMLPWLKCALTLECIDPIGAQSNGCKFNKKPLYRYSGCHGYDASAFNIVLGLTWHLDDSKYSLPCTAKENMFYKETLEQATKILENRRRNTSDTSDHPFTED